MQVAVFSCTRLHYISLHEMQVVYGAARDSSGCVGLHVVQGLDMAAIQ